MSEVSGGEVSQPATGFDKKVPRRGFLGGALKILGALGIGAASSGCNGQVIKTIEEVSSVQAETEKENSLQQEPEKLAKETILNESAEKAEKIKQRGESLQKTLLNQGIIGQVNPIGGELNPEEKIRVVVTAQDGLFLRTLPQVKEETKITFLDPQGQPKQAFSPGEMPAGMQFEVKIGQDLWYAVKLEDLKFYSQFTVVPNDRIKKTDLGEQYVFFCARQGETSFISDKQAVK